MTTFYVQTNIKIRRFAILQADFKNGLWVLRS